MIRRVAQGTARVVRYIALWPDDRPPEIAPEGRITRPVWARVDQPAPEGLVARVFSANLSGRVCSRAAVVGVAHHGTTRLVLLVTCLGRDPRLSFDLRCVTPGC